MRNQNTSGSGNAPCRHKLCRRNWYKSQSLQPAPVIIVCCGDPAGTRGLRTGTCWGQLLGVGRMQCEWAAESHLLLYKSIVRPLVTA